MTPELGLALALKAAGAAIGAVLALVFVPPRSILGFLKRLIVSIPAGIIFSTDVRNWLGFDPGWEGLVASACLAAFASWWVAGTIIRISREWRSNKAGQED
jgi:hypothetical protein